MTDADSLCTLHDTCNWSYLDKSAIEYHDFGKLKIINYKELQMAKETVCDCLKTIQYPQFIGINFDILEYCVPTLMLGILESGNAFFNVPSDPVIYKEICASLHAKYIFTHVTSTEEVLYQCDIHGQSVYLTKLIDVPKSNANNIRLHHFAYAIATSGSTGIPKIIKVSHSCILPNLIDLSKILVITESDKIAQLTNFTFDPSIIEIFLSLFCAATLFMVSKTLKNESDRLLDKIFQSHVTFLQITPSLLFHKWSFERLKSTILDKDSHLRVLLLGGEPFLKKKLLFEASHPQNKTRLFNIYGITEISCWSSINELIKTDDTDESYLGESLSKTLFQIRNTNDEIIMKGEGILYIGSYSRVCIIGNETEGDLNKPVFRNSGDIVSIDDRGKIFYRGRTNSVIKRFGNKVNLQELEKNVMELSFVQNCITFWDAECHKLFLCLSITKTKEESSNLQNDIILHLKTLPSISKPDKIIIVEHFALTTSGKICLASLKRICRDSETEITSANDLPTNVDEIFENLWNQHVRSNDAGFLMSGGTSITALQISSSVTDIFKTEFPELIGMLLRNVMSDECVDYIKSALANRDRNKNPNRLIDVSNYNKSSRKMFNTEKLITKEPLNNLSILTSKQNSYQWYKCRGRIYGDASTQSTGSLLANISNIEVQATYNLQKCIDASATIYCYSETEVFATVGSHAGIVCTVNLMENNSKSYETKLPDRIEASVLILIDFRGIVGCYDGYIYCIHLKTGEVIWKFQTQDMVKCTAITCAQGSKIFVGSYDRHVYCLSTEDGTQIWKTKGSQGGICATGCLHEQSTSVLFGTLDGSCLALQQFSGRITWKQKLQDPIFVAPVVLRTGRVLFCTVAGTLCCFDIETDCRMWRHDIHGNIFSFPVIRTREFANKEHIILASHNKDLYCLEMPRETVEGNRLELRYTLKFHSAIFATPWCEGEYMFVACTDGTLQIFNLLSGKLLISKQLPGETFSSPVVHDNLVVLGCRDNNLYILRFN